MMQDAPADGERTFSNADLMTIANHQKFILLCILVYMIAVVGQFLLPPDLRPLLGLSMLVVVLVSVVFVFMLAIKLSGTAVGVVQGILTFIPLIGLLVLLMVNGKATRVLRAHGVEVGLLGAKGMGG